MKKRSGRLLTMCITVFCLCFLLASCGKAESLPVETAGPLETETQEMMLLWENYLAVMEDAYSHMDWALDYARQFADDNSWESLQKARAASSAAKIYIQNLPLPEFTLSQEQCIRLMEAGIEADVVQSEYLNLPAEKTLLENTMTSLETKLQHDVFLSANVSVLGDWVDIQYETIKDISEYLCLTTNYLLLQTKNDALWNLLPEKYPGIASVRNEWYEDADLLMQNTALVFDRYQDRFVQMEELLGTAEYTLILVQEALETGNLEYLIRELHSISGVPAYLPAPEWLPEDASYHYFAAEHGTGENRLIQSGENLSEPPASCYISCTGISREQVEAYGAHLKTWGITSLVDWNEAEQTYQVFVILDQSQIVIQWTQEETVIYLTDPIACMIPHLYLLAMLS